MKRILTGVKPTGGGLHVGNYFGAIKPLIEFSKTYETFLFIADYHALTSVHDAETLKKNKQSILMEYISLIGDNDNIIIFEQSEISSINNIAWILSSVTPYSLMLRAHTFKDSKAKNVSINVATFNYPILMAADIITYDVDLVPIGKDQIQHLEFARDIAESFNKTYKVDFFKLPEYYIEKDLQTIPGTDGRKMSKSYNNFIPIFASEEEIKKSIMSIVTDNTPLESPKDPDKCNVFKLISLFANREKLSEIRKRYLEGNYGYGHAKLELFHLMLEYFKKPRERFEMLKANLGLIDEKLSRGNAIANKIANDKFFKMKEIVGLGKILSGEG